MSQLGTVYLIHFERPLAHARHYIGWTQDEEVLLAAVQAQGIPFRVARRWRGTRHHERYLKKQRHAPQFCPICSESPRDPRWPESLNENGGPA